MSNKNKDYFRDLKSFGDMSHVIIVGIRQVLTTSHSLKLSYYF